MKRKIVLCLFISVFLLAGAGEAFGQRKIVRYASRIQPGQNYAYYRYQRRVVSSPQMMPRPGFFWQQPVCQPVYFQSPPVYQRNFIQQQPLVFEDEIREEFVTWPSETRELASSGSALEALEREIADLRDEVGALARSVGYLTQAGPERWQGTGKPAEGEKMERLKKELQELKTLLEQLKKRN